MAKKSVASASKRKKAPRRMNTQLVADYLARLEKALGKDSEFSDVFSELQKDSLVTQVEAVAIGSKFVAPMAASTPKTKAFERILKRHKSLLTFKLKQRAVGGRSAA